MISIISCLISARTSAVNCHFLDRLIIRRISRHGIKVFNQLTKTIPQWWQLCQTGTLTTLKNSKWSIWPRWIDRSTSFKTKEKMTRAKPLTRKQNLTCFWIQTLTSLVGRLSHNWGQKTKSSTLGRTIIAWQDLISWKLSSLTWSAIFSHLPIQWTMVSCEKTQTSRWLKS